MGTEAVVFLKVFFQDYCRLLGTWIASLKKGKTRKKRHKPEARSFVVCTITLAVC